MPFFVCVVPGLELRAYTLSHSPALFVLDIFEIGSCELFAQGGFRTMIVLSFAS
jgi:hypothetical protein